MMPYPNIFHQSKSVIFLSLAVCAAVAPTLSAQEALNAHDTATSLDMQDARARLVKKVGGEKSFTKRFDIGGLPHYIPQQQLSGIIRFWGNNYIGDSHLAEYWRTGFRKFQPNLDIDYHLPTHAAAIAGLFCGVADIGMSRKATFLEQLAYERTMKCDPIEITAVTGTDRNPGWMVAFAIVVNAKNPLQKLTMKQLDGIFGSGRELGWVGTAPHREYPYARGAEENLRKWGQLGLTGDWADRKISVYGYSFRYNNSTLFSDAVLKSSDQWNGDMHVAANYVKPDGTLYVEALQIMDRIEEDPYGIGYVCLRGPERPRLRVLSIAKQDDGPYYPLTLENVQSLKYPLYCQNYFYLNKLPGQQIDPKVKEFVRYVLSQEGQLECERDGKYVPLTAEVVQEQLKKLN
jgi:phosphate transport system substrate-binding protein